MRQIQGAAEIVLARCTQVLDTSGVAVPLGPEQRAELEDTITQVRGSKLTVIAASIKLG